MALLLPKAVGRTEVTATYHQIVGINLTYGSDGVFVVGTISLLNYVDQNADDAITQDTVTALSAPQASQNPTDWALSIVLADPKYFGAQPAPNKMSTPKP